VGLPLQRFRAAFDEMQVRHVKNHRSAGQAHGIRHSPATHQVSGDIAGGHFREAAAGHHGRPNPRCSLVPFRPYLNERAKQGRPGGLAAAGLLREIRALGYQGSAFQLRIWLAKHQATRIDEGTMTSLASEPGRQMLVDFSVCRRGHSPMFAFIATLSHSQMTFVNFVPDESCDSVHDALLLAFNYFAGIPQEVLFDQEMIDRLVLDGHPGDPFLSNADLWQMAEQLGFRWLPLGHELRLKARIKRAQRYVQTRFFDALDSRVSSSGFLLDCATANRQVGDWLAKEANVRMLLSLDERPIDRWRRERLRLKPLPLAVLRDWAPLLADRSKPPLRDPR
jgi:transposase